MNEVGWKPLPPVATGNRVADLNDERCHVEAFLPRPGLLVVRVQGHLTGEAARGLVEVLDRVVRPGSTTEAFCDWALMTSYDSQARKVLTDWTLEHRSSVGAGWFVSGSALVSMGIAAAGAVLTLVGLRVHAVDRPAFSAELNRRLSS